MHPPEDQARTAARPRLLGSDLGPGRGADSFTFTPEVAASTIEYNFDAFGEFRDVVRGMGISREGKDFLFLIRIQIGLYSVLGALRATGNWRAIQTELLRGDPPTTDVGRQHQAWKTHH